MRVATLSESLPQHRQRAYAATTHNTITIFSTIRDSKLYFRFFAIIYILYLYLTCAGVVPYLTTITTVPLCAHPLRRRFAIITTITLPFSN
jgi:hypothetical protein